MLLSALTFATEAIFVKLLQAQGASFLGIMFWRYAIAGAGALLLIALFRPKRRLTSLKRMAVVTVLDTTKTALFVGGLTQLTAGVAILALFTYPAMIVLFERWKTRRPVGRVKLLALGASFLGLLLVVHVQPSALSLGLVLVLGAAALQAVFLLLLGDVMKTAHPVWLSLSTSTVTVTVFGVLFSFSRGPFVPASGTLWAGLVGIGLLATLVPRLALYSGARGLPASIVGILGAFEPPVTVLLALFVLGEQLSLLQWLGCLLIFASVAVISRFERLHVPTP